MEHIVYANRNPNENDWKLCPNLFVNGITDTLFIKGSKGWIKVNTEYVAIHNQPERSKREDIRNPFLDEIPECYISNDAVL